MDDIDEALELVAKGAVFSAMNILCGGNRQKQQAFRDTLRLASEFDEDDWDHVRRWLNQDAPYIAATKRR